MLAGALTLLGKILNLRIPCAVVLAIVAALSGVLLMQQGKLVSRAHEVKVATDKLDDETGKLNAASASLNACRANSDTLQTALEDQTAKTRAAADAASAKLAEASRLAQAAAADRAKAAAMSAQVNAYRTAPTSDVCADLLAADAVVQRSLK